MSDPRISSLALHYVGNQANEEPLLLSKKIFALNPDMNELLSNYFINSFKSEERYQFHDDIDIRNNRVYSLISDIFDNSHMLFDFSIDLATHLYENCEHPKIKGGDFYVAYFNGCSVGVEGCDAIGLFKIENKDIFLTVDHEEECFDIGTEEGVNLKKLDKGCLIFNYEREKGYLVSVVDNTNRSEATYWVDDFLHLMRREDAYFQTENIMTICRNFLAEELPKQFEVNRADQVDMLNKSMNFFKKTPKFEMDNFTQQIMGQPEVIEKFDNYKNRFQEERQLRLQEAFDVNQTAVKKQSRVFKSIIKLDKNFHVYIHGSRELIERGEDEHGKFYKLYFQEES